MPEGDIPKDYANNYVPMYLDEYGALKTIFSMPLWLLSLPIVFEIGIMSYLEKVFESGIYMSLQPLSYCQEIKKLEEDIYMKYLDNFGTCDSSLKLLISVLIELLPCGLCNSSVSLANVLGKSTWKYVLSTASTVLPLFATTLYNMLNVDEAFQVRY